MAKVGTLEHYAEAQGALKQADYIANADNWPGERAERAADVTNALLRSLACSALVIAGELGALRMDGLPPTKEP